MLFLACQCVTGASAASAEAGQAGASAAQEPCHGAGGETGKNTDATCQAQCQYQNVSPAPSNAVHAITDLPAVAIAFDHTADVAPAAPSLMLPLARAESPPLSILHCCLRQ
jgi:hypothetical protein